MYFKHHDPLLSITCTQLERTLELEAIDANTTQTRLRWSYIEVIATTMLWKSTRTGWPLRNIHFSNNNGSFSLYVNLSFLCRRKDFFRTWRMSYKLQELFTLREHLCSKSHPLIPVFFFGRSVLFIYLGFSGVFFVFVCLHFTSFVQCCLCPWNVN